MRCAVIASLLGLVLARPALEQRSSTPAPTPQAPRVIELKPSASCRSCTIKLTRVQTLREGGEQYGGLTAASVLAWDSRGRLYIVNGVNMGQILVFDRSGRFLQIVGKAGGGPGEFQAIGSIHVGTGDTLHIFDQESRSYTKLTPEYEVAGSAKVGINVQEALELRPGQMVVNSDDGASEGSAQPLRLFDQKTLAKPFGGSDPFGSTDQIGGIAAREFARETSTTFWALHAKDYIIDLWSTAGGLQKRLVRRAEWLRQASRFTLEGRANPTVYDFQRDSLGRLWVILAVRSSRFRELAIERGKLGNGIPVLGSKSGNMRDLREGVIEVIDPNRGEVLATIRLPREVGRFAGPGMIEEYGVDELGRGSISLMRVDLLPAPSRPGF